MAINLERALSIHSTALQLRSQRAQVIANNLANADTPNFQARDIDFQAALHNALGDNSLTTTHRNHFGAPQGMDESPALSFRPALQPNLDGNTVDAAREQAAFADNALRYQASLRFFGDRIQSLVTALKGE